MSNPVIFYTSMRDFFSYVPFTELNLCRWKTKKDGIWYQDVWTKTWSGEIHIMRFYDNNLPCLYTRLRDKYNCYRRGIMLGSLPLCDFSEPELKLILSTSGPLAQPENPPPAPPDAPKPAALPVAPPLPTTPEQVKAAECFLDQERLKWSPPQAEAAIACQAVPVKPIFEQIMHSKKKGFKRLLDEGFFGKLSLEEQIQVKTRWYKIMNQPWPYTPESEMFPYPKLENSF